MTTTIYYAKVNQEKWWKYPNRKFKNRVTKMSEEDYLATMEIVKNIQNGKQ